MAPTGKWNVDYGENGCILGRQFGSGKNSVILGWRALPLDDDMELQINQPGYDESLRLGTVALSLAGRSDKVLSQSFPATLGMRRITAWVKAATFADLPADATLTLTPSRGKALRVTLSGGKNAFAALATCNQSLLKEWGIDPAETAAIATPASGDAARWYHSSDYPIDALRRGAIGNTTMLWTVATDGSVPECRVLIRSGTDSLDDAACAAAKRRGRFTPAMGHDGKPVTSHKVARLTWSFPGSWQADAAHRALKHQLEAERADRGS